MGSEPKCPQCGKDLRRVTYDRDSMLNSEQFDAVRSGDWYCTECKGDQARSGYRYYWDRELEIPAPTPTITIPVAEYEGLKRRAKLYEALPAGETGDGWAAVVRGLVHMRDGTKPFNHNGWCFWNDLADALRAAIKEQEG